MDKCDTCDKPLEENGNCNYCYMEEQDAIQEDLHDGVRQGLEE